MELSVPRYLSSGLSRRAVLWLCVGRRLRNVKAHNTPGQDTFDGVQSRRQDPGRRVAEVDVDGGITDDGLVSDKAVSVDPSQRSNAIPPWILGILLDLRLYPFTQSYTNRFPLSSKAMRPVVDLIPPRVRPAGYR